MIMITNEFLAGFELISFDVFDTLLLRPFARPTDLFRKLEHDTGANGFAEARIAAEKRANRRARQKGLTEARFDEIYAEIPKWAAMKEKELEAERQCLVANPEVVAVWNAAKAMGKKVVIASDMYLPAPFLKDVLTSNGIDGWDGFYLSNECQAQKWSGALYDLVLKDFGLPPEKVLHIGDNNHSDVLSANQRGIVAYGYQKVIDRFFAECPFAKSFSRAGENDFLCGALSLGWHLYKFNHPGWTYWNRLGFLFAGVLGFAYMSMVGEDARCRGMDRLLFVMRDGYVLERIFKVLFPDLRTDLIWGSRAQAVLATRYMGRTAIGIDARRKYILKCLRDRLGVSLSDCEESEYLQTGKLPRHADSALDQAGREVANEVKAYVEQFQIDPVHTAIVDGTSTHFTMQRFFGSMVGRDLFTYYLFTNLPVENGLTMTCADWDLRYLRFAEFLFGSPHPPLEGIRAGKTVFAEEVHVFERFKMQHSEEIAAGAADCAAVLKRFGVGVSHSLWMDWNDAFMDNQSPEDCEHMALARDSIAIDHTKEFSPVIVPPAARVPVVKVFGRTLLGARRCRIGTVRSVEVYFLNRIRIAKFKRRALFNRIEKLVLKR